ncbi:MAG: hypothetical protein ACKOXP_03440 [Flavobacteriales bacterium]
MKSVMEIWQSIREESTSLSADVPSPEMACSKEFSFFAEALAEAYQQNELIESDWFHQFILLKPSAFYEVLEFNRLLELGIKDSIRKGMKRKMARLERRQANLEASEGLEREVSTSSQIKFQLSRGLPNFASAEYILAQKQQQRRKKSKQIIKFILLIIIALGLLLYFFS